MKKQMLLTGFALLFAAVLFTACQKEEQPVIPIEEEAFTAPDSINDLVGFFSSFHEVFFIDPAYMENVLEYVGATPTSDGRFQTTVVLENGEILDYFFWMVPVPAPELYFQAQELDKPVLEEEKEDKWKLYKNAICPEKANNAKEESDCETVNDDKDGARSKKTVIAPYKTCIYNANENNLCREVKGKIGTTTFYEKLKCTGKKLRTEDYNGFRCGV
jgi:hypothetical protein